MLGNGGGGVGLSIKLHVSILAAEVNLSNTAEVGLDLIWGHSLGEVSNEHTLGVQGCGVHGLALTAGTGRGTIGTGRAGDTGHKWLVEVLKLDLDGTATLECGVGSNGGVGLICSLVLGDGEAVVLGSLNGELAESRVNLDELGVLKRVGQVAEEDVRWGIVAVGAGLGCWAGLTRGTGLAGGTGLWGTGLTGGALTWGTCLGSSGGGSGGSTIVVGTGTALESWAKTRSAMLLDAELAALVVGGVQDQRSLNGLGTLEHDATNTAG